ncbi:MAG: hypothetical protein R2788_24625 [Saprospiraceae bacterium]
MVKALDTHDMGRGRGGAAAALERLTMPALVICCNSDLLIPPEEQRFLNAHFAKIDLPGNRIGVWARWFWWKRRESRRRAILEWQNHLLLRMEFHVILSQILLSA